MGQWEVCVVVRKKSERRCGLHGRRFAPEMILEAAHSADPQHSWKVYRPGSDYNLVCLGHLEEEQQELRPAAQRHSLTQVHPGSVVIIVNILDIESVMMLLKAGGGDSLACHLTSISFVFVRLFQISLRGSSLDSLSDDWLLLFSGVWCHLYVFHAEQ